MPLVPYFVGVHYICAASCNLMEICYMIKGFESDAGTFDFELQAKGDDKFLCFTIFLSFKGCGMVPWLVLVSPCFRENVVATCKIGSFLCSLDNLLQKNVIVLFFGNQISKRRSFEKMVIFDLLFTFFSHQGKVTKIPSAHISLTYIHVFCSPNWLFLSYQFWKKNTNLSGMVSLWYESWCWFSFAPFWNKQ